MKFNYWLALVLVVPLAADAAEFNWSGFGTAGYAISDSANRYQRFITDRGTFNRDSVFGGQLDVKFNQQFGATVQARLARRPTATRAGSLRWPGPFSPGDRSMIFCCAPASCACR
ncbi:hypothetical protein [Dechloromonas sp. A34]|uniref:hypothetical protein n=1 Tax=Dechloromonas sp. A34 TaxID=447588 RepID=UPI0022490B5C|nr:hypothetical protein [Dechloromonas sp. A34]